MMIFKSSLTFQVMAELTNIPDTGQIREEPRRLSSQRINELRCQALEKETREQKEWLKEEEGIDREKEVDRYEQTRKTDAAGTAVKLPGLAMSAAGAFARLCTKKDGSKKATKTPITQSYSNQLYKCDIEDQVVSGDQFDWAEYIRKNGRSPAKNDLFQCSFDLSLTVLQTLVKPGELVLWTGVTKITREIGEVDDAMEIKTESFVMAIVVSVFEDCVQIRNDWSINKIEIVLVSDLYHCPEWFRREVDKGMEDESNSRRQFAPLLHNDWQMISGKRLYELIQAGQFFVIGDEDNEGMQRVAVVVSSKGGIVEYRYYGDEEEKTDNRKFISVASPRARPLYDGWDGAPSAFRAKYENQSNTSVHESEEASPELQIKEDDGWLWNNRLCSLVFRETTRRSEYKSKLMKLFQSRKSIKKLQPRMLVEMLDTTSCCTRFVPGSVIDVQKNIASVIMLTTDMNKTRLKFVDIHSGWLFYKGFAERIGAPIVFPEIPDYEKYKEKNGDDLDEWEVLRAAMDASTIGNRVFLSNGEQLPSWTFATRKHIHNPMLTEEDHNIGYCEVLMRDNKIGAFLWPATIHKTHGHLLELSLEGTPKNQSHFYLPFTSDEIFEVNFARKHGWPIFKPREVSSEAKRKERSMNGRGEVENSEEEAMGARFMTAVYIKDDQWMDIVYLNSGCVVNDKVFDKRKLVQLEPFMDEGPLTRILPAIMKMLYSVIRDKSLFNTAVNGTKDSLGSIQVPLTFKANRQQPAVPFIACSRASHFTQWIEEILHRLGACPCLFSFVPAVDEMCLYDCRRKQLLEHHGESDVEEFNTKAQARAMTNSVGKDNASRLLRSKSPAREDNVATTSGILYDRTPTREETLPTPSQPLRSRSPVPEPSPTPSSTRGRRTEKRRGRPPLRAQVSGRGKTENAQTGPPDAQKEISGGRGTGGRGRGRGGGRAGGIQMSTMVLEGEKRKDHVVEEMRSGRKRRAEYMESLVGEPHDEVERDNADNHIANWDVTMEMPTSPSPPGLETMTTSDSMQKEKEEEERVEEGGGKGKKKEEKKNVNKNISPEEKKNNRKTQKRDGKSEIQRLLEEKKVLPVTSTPTLSALLSNPRGNRPNQAQIEPTRVLMNPPSVETFTPDAIPKSERQTHVPSTSPSNEANHSSPSTSTAIPHSQKNPFQHSVYHSPLYLPPNPRKNAAQALGLANTPQLTVAEALKRSRAPSKKAEESSKTATMSSRSAEGSMKTTDTPSVNIAKAMNSPTSSIKNSEQPLKATKTPAKKSKGGVEAATVTSSPSETQKILGILADATKQMRKGEPQQKAPRAKKCPAFDYLTKEFLKPPLEAVMNLPSGSGQVLTTQPDRKRKGPGIDAVAEQIRKKKQSKPTVTVDRKEEIKLSSPTVDVSSSSSHLAVPHSQSSLLSPAESSDSHQHYEFPMRKLINPSDLETVHSDPRTWTVLELYAFVRATFESGDFVEKLRERDIDGMTFLGLDLESLDDFDLQVGPRLFMIEIVERLKALQREQFP